MYLRRLLWNIFLLQMQYSFTAVDRVVQRSLPKVFVNLYGDTAYLELTNAYGLFRRCVLRLHLSLLGIQRSHPVCVADAKKGMERGIKERNVKGKEVPFLLVSFHSPFFPYPHSSSKQTSPNKLIRRLSLSTLEVRLTQEIKRIQRTAVLPIV